MYIIIDFSVLFYSFSDEEHVSGCDCETKMLFIEKLKNVILI